MEDSKSRSVHVSASESNKQQYFDFELQKEISSLIIHSKMDVLKIKKAEFCHNSADNDSLINFVFNELLKVKDYNNTTLFPALAMNAIGAGLWMSYSAWYDKLSKERLFEKRLDCIDTIIECVNDGSVYDIITFLLGIMRMNEQQDKAGLELFCKKLSNIAIDVNMTGIEFFSKMYRVGIILYQSEE